MAFYSCPYTYIDSRICGKKCYQKEECHIHWKRQTHISCNICGIPIASSYGMCMKHAGKYYSKANYYKNKLQDKKHDQASQ
ncbi:8639_t:CDS:1, partial [Funneliformis mosseae]